MATKEELNEAWNSMANFAFDALVKSAERYEKVRKLNPQQFRVIYEKNIRTGVPFDELIDRLTKE